MAQNPDDAETYYNRGRVLIDLNRNDDAALDFQKALAIKPAYAEARVAACFAELPILYADEEEIARRRAGYEQILRALHDDVEAGTAQGDLLNGISVKEPFLLAYQGQCDRNLQTIYGSTVCRIVQQQSRPLRRHRRKPASPSESAWSAVSSFGTPTGKFRSKAGSASSTGSDSRSSAITRERGATTTPKPPPACATASSIA